MKLQHHLGGMTRRLSTALIIGAGTIGAAQAALVTVASNVTIQGTRTNPTVTGPVSMVDLNAAAASGSFLPGTGAYYYGGWNAGPYVLTIDAPAAEGLVKGNLSGQAPTQTYAAPVDQNGQAVTGYYLSTGGYGAAATQDGVADAPGNGDIRLTFATAESYLGLLWGSIDQSNFLKFYNGSTLVATITGTQVNTASTDFTGYGGQGPGGSQYVMVNFLNGQKFTSVVMGNTSPAAPSFEAANFEYAATNVTNVPEPANLALLGIGFAGMLVARRRRA